MRKKKRKSRKRQNLFTAKNKVCHICVFIMPTEVYPFFSEDFSSKGQCLVALMKMSSEHVSSEM